MRNLFIYITGYLCNVVLRNRYPSNEDWINWDFEELSKEHAIHNATFLAYQLFDYQTKEELLKQS